MSVRAFMVSVRPVCHCDFAIRINGECVRVNGGYPWDFMTPLQVKVGSEVAQDVKQIEEVGMDTEVNQ